MVSYSTTKATYLSFATYPQEPTVWNSQPILFFPRGQAYPFRHTKMGPDFRVTLDQGPGDLWL